MARVAFEGRSAHSARPWLGVNAIALALEGLRPVLEAEPLDVDVEGLVFREVVSVTQIDDCGNASNVIPGRVEATLNYRYAPSRTPAEAEARLRELVGGELDVVQHSPGAPVAARSPLVERLRDIGGFEVEPKQAWTNVADFAARGLDAINFGPGATRYAHTPDEQVAVSELARSFDALKRFLAA
jgi:succinyl-diaminopimelate desuccinylase